MNHSKLTLVSLPGAGFAHQIAELEVISVAHSEFTGGHMSHASQREADFEDGECLTKPGGPDYMSEQKTKFNETLVSQTTLVKEKVE